MAHVVDNLISEGLSDTASMRYQMTSAATANTTTTLTSASTYYQVFTGSTGGQIIRLPNATTVSLGHTFEFWNISSVLVTVQDNSGTVLLVLSASQMVQCVCNGTGSAAGSWLILNLDQSTNLNLANTFTAIDDFLAGTAVVSTLGTLRWTIFNTGTGGLITAPSANQDPNHIGVANLAVGAVSSIASLALGDMNIAGGQFITEWLVRVGALGNGTNNYVLQFGFGDNEQTTSDPTNGIFFEYSQAGSTAWRTKTTKASTTTTTASSVTVAANTWYKLKFIINPAGTSVDFYVSTAGGGIASFAHTVATNIPLSSVNIRPFFKIRKTVGTGTVSYDTDYFQMQVNLTNLR